MLRSPEDIATIYTPRDYLIDAPERLNGDEYELRPSDGIHVSGITSADYAQANLGAFGRIDCHWLTNGTYIHTECGDHVEIGTAETRGPLDGAAEKVAAVRAARRIFHCAFPVPTHMVGQRVQPDYKQSETVYFHAASEVNGELKRRGFHHTMMGPAKILQDPWLQATLDTHLAVSGIWAGAGLLTRSGFRIVQKDGIGAGKERKRHLALLADGRDAETDIVQPGWLRAEIRVQDANRSVVTDFLYRASGSLILRMFEHAPKLSDTLRTELRGICLRNPMRSLATVAGDLTLRQPLPCNDGQRRTAGQIGRVYATIAGELANEVKLPESEMRGIRIWHYVLDVLERTDPQGDDIDEAAQIIHWAQRMQRMQARSDKKITAWNTRDRRLHNLSLGLDLIYPIDPMEGFVKRTAVGIIPPELIARLETAPPDDTRAAARAKLIEQYGHELQYVRWDGGALRRRGTVALDPFSPELRITAD